MISKQRIFKPCLVSLPALRLSTLRVGRFFCHINSEGEQAQDAASMAFVVVIASVFRLSNWRAAPCAFGPCLHVDADTWSTSVIVREFSSLSNADAWHASKGYISRRAADCIVWHPTKGPSAQFTHHSN